MKKHCAKLVGTSLTLEKTLLCMPPNISSMKSSCEYYAPNPISIEDEENQLEEHRCHYGWSHVLVTECINREVQDEVKLNMKLEEI